MPNEIRNLLEFDEKVLLAFQEAGIGGKVTGLESIFVTDKRVIKMKPKTFGLRVDITDYLYKDMANVNLNRGMLRSSIHIKMRFSSEDTKVYNIPKEGADKIFKTIQEGIAGRLVKEVPTQSTDEGVSSSQIDITEQIRKLGELKDAGLLTEEEFQMKKQELLSKM